MKKVKILCFPYAGGSAAIYNKWKPYLDDSIELIPVELAGRGRRFKEKFYKDMSHAIDDIYNIIWPAIKGSEYSFFGHSMGTVIALELCHRIMEDKQKPPLHLFVSGRYPPNILKKEKYLSRLPDNEFKDEIFKLGGTSEEVLKNRELCDIFIPILKSDYRLIEEYEYTNKKQKLDYGITAFNGSTDPDVTYSEMLEWGNHTTAQSSVYEFDGDHFFIHNKSKEITKIINDTLVFRIVANTNKL